MAKLLYNKPLYWLSQLVFFISLAGCVHEMIPVFFLLLKYIIKSFSIYQNIRPIKATFCMSVDQHQN